MDDFETPPSDPETARALARYDRLLEERSPNPAQETVATRREAQTQALAAYIRDSVLELVATDAGAGYARFLDAAGRPKPVTETPDLLNLTLPFAKTPATTQFAERLLNEAVVPAIRSAWAEAVREGRIEDVTVWPRNADGFYLAERTRENRVREGFAPDMPWLRTGRFARELEQGFEVQVEDFGDDAVVASWGWRQSSLRSPFNDLTSGNQHAGHGGLVVIAGHAPVITPAVAAQAGRSAERFIRDHGADLLEGPLVDLDAVMDIAGLALPEPTE